MLNRSIQRAFLTLSLPVLTSACTALAPSEIALPLGAVQITAPAIYREWLAKTEACSGRTGDFATLEFYVVPGVETFPTNDGSKVGEWITAGRLNRIVIAGNYQGHEMVVRHELLHALLRAEGHPTEYFVHRCQLTWESWNFSIASVALEHAN